MRKFFLAVLLVFAAVAQSAPNKVLVVDIGVIGTASDTILQSVIERAGIEGFTAVLIRLDTPGGSLDATHAMVKNILAAPLPIYVWVGPAGSRAGSAGAFITLAAHFAGMAPGTNIGAAHPIEASGEDLKKESARKIENDTLAFVESLAHTRGRNVEMARSFVLSSVSITDVEALQNKVIDASARDEAALLSASDGKVVELGDARKVTLRGKDAEFVTYQKSWRERALEILSHPQVFYLLFLGGMIGLGYELTHTGAVFPGVAGVICMILALIATSVLPVNIGFAALMLAGLIMIIAEFFVPAFGVLMIGGTVAFIIGSFFLVDSKNEQGLRLAWSFILPTALTVLAVFSAIAYSLIRTLRLRKSSKTPTIVNDVGECLSDFVEGRGKVRVQGEIWSAQQLAGDSPLLKGERIVIVSVSNLLAQVKRP